MARHNRRRSGVDQHGREYSVCYQPDWLRYAKVTRFLADGRQSTRTLFQNPERGRGAPGGQVRTHVAAPELGLDVGLSLRDEHRVVRRVLVEVVIPEGAPGAGERVGLLLCGPEEHDG